MNRDRVRIKRSRLLRLAALFLLLAAVSGFRVPAFAGDTEAESAAEKVPFRRQKRRLARTGDGRRQPVRQGNRRNEAPEVRREGDCGPGERGSGRRVRPAAGSRVNQRSYGEWDEDAPAPEGYYTVILDDIRPDVPAEGRPYDGTDRISLKYSVKIRREDSGAQKRLPPIRSSAAPGLTDCDAGRRQVIYSFALRTPYPDHIKLERDREYPKLAVEVKKAVLRVRIPDGTKAYMDPPDLEHISLSGNGEVAVSGFALDADGREVIPEGFIPPQITVDTRILKQNSPMYRPAEEEDGGGRSDDGTGGGPDGGG